MKNFTCTHNETIKAAGRFIKIDASGVHMVGGAINLNSFFSPGGSPGAGSGFSGLLPKLPLGAESPEYDAPMEDSDPPSVAGAQQSSLALAAEEGIPICAECDAAAEAEEQ